MPQPVSGCHGLSPGPCSQPCSYCCPRRVGFFHPCVFWTLCKLGAIPGCGELQARLPARPHPRAELFPSHCLHPEAPLSAACWLGPACCSSLTPSLLHAAGLCLCGPFSPPRPPSPTGLHPDCGPAPALWVPLVKHHLGRPP